MLILHILGRKTGRDGGTVKSLRSLQEIVALPPSPSPQTIFCDGGPWEERKDCFVPIIHFMVHQQP